VASFFFLFLLLLLSFRRMSSDPGRFTGIHRDIYIAACYGNCLALERLMAQVEEPFLPNPQISNEWPLHVAALHGRHHTVSWLIQRGHPVDPQQSYGWTPLHYAAYFNHSKTICELLKQGANCCALNNRGETPAAIPTLSPILQSTLFNKP